MTTPGRDLIGKDIDPFRIDEFIGQGAMGVVYKAFDRVLHRSVALKLIPKGQEGLSLSMVEARKRLVREAQAAGCLSHPNLVTIHSYGETDDFQYICMEYIAGRSFIRQAMTEMRYYEICRDLSPSFQHEVLTNLGLCYYKKKNFQKAQVLLKEALRLNPKNSKAQMILRSIKG